MLTRLSLMLLLPVLLSAQPDRGPKPGLRAGGPKPWWDGEIARDLNLSDGQMKQIRETRKEFRPRMQEVRDSVNKAEADLDAALNEDPVDQAKANEAINRLAAARDDMFKTVSRMELKMRMVLTAQQWQTLKAKQRRPWPGGPGPGRHGVPAGPTATSNQK